MPKSHIARHFTSYSGIKLPLNLVGELETADMRNRNTYFRGTFNDQQQLIRCEKIVYRETEFRHDYHYHDNGQLARAEIDDGNDDPVTLEFPI